MASDQLSWAKIPTRVLEAELRRRQTDTERPTCGSGNLGKYNTSIHVFALVLILVLSVASCAFPVAAKRFPQLPVPRQFLFLSRHFGTGVLIATAFVHLFPTAYVSLTDPCLAPFWNQHYTPMAGLIAMVSVFVVVGIEMFFAMRGAGHMHGAGDFDTLSDVGESYGGHHGRSVNFRKKSLEMNLDGDGENDNLMNGQSPETPSSAFPRHYQPRHGRKSSEANASDALELNELDPIPDAASMTNASIFNDPQNMKPDQKALLQCLLLEAGILFHSIFIGMALSVTPAPPFYVLLVAISFHQTFEGLALGSRIASLNFPPTSMAPWFMALAYGTTTPIGQAIGLAIHSLYDPASEIGLLSVGIMNAVSSGLLLFAGLVELLAADFLSEESFESLRGKRRLKACGAVLCGAAMMALVGAWA